MLLEKIIKIQLLTEYYAYLVTVGNANGILRTKRKILELRGFSVQKKGLS